GYAGKPLIEIDGTIAGPAANGLVLMARGSTVRGLAINRFQLNGLWLLGEGEHLVEANYIGLDPTGELDQGNAQSGIRIDSPDNVVGLSAAAFAAEARNVISGNGMDGIAIFGAFAKNNLVRGNFIGTDDDAETAIANAGDGVAISGASENEIGHHDGGIATRSVIAGNTRNGISIVGASAVLNRIRGNHIGITDVGNTALGNGDNGIDVQSPFNVIGGTAADHRNVIGGNGEDGLLLHNAADQNQILGNRIGVGVSSELPPLPNGSGILISDAEQNIIGGAQDGAGNLLAGNTNFGLAIIGTDAIRNQVSGNDIGWAAGDTVGNGLGGVLIHDGSANIIGGLQGVEPGGTCQGDCNSISDNGGAGVIVTGDAATNRIRGNSIFRNAGLGIDLGRDGITWGDPGDLDVGPNALFNAPEIVSVTFSASTVTFTGTLDTQNPAAAFVDVYASSFLGAGGLTEGTRYVGSTSPDANGNWTLTTSVTLSDSDYYTATASGQFGPTSEFSHCVDPDGDGSPDSDGDGLCDTWETLGIDFDGDEVIDLQLYDLDQDGTVQAGERADPMHKDLFVEADWMAQHQPNSQAL
ncbi:MAG: right-handed parallel beta-helix repeat-containing protein, partial [Dehalococcoidia bacterium]